MANATKIQQAQHLYPYRNGQRVNKAKVLHFQKRRSENGFAKFIQLVFLIWVGICVLPQGYNKITKPIFITPFFPTTTTAELFQNSEFSSNLTPEYYTEYKPTLKYLNNNYFMGKASLEGANLKKPQMQSLYTTGENLTLKTDLKKLANTYPMLTPSIYVWNYDSGEYINIDSEKPYPTASIIKLPVLIELFKSLEKTEDYTLSTLLTLENHNRSEGSGTLQYKPNGTRNSIDQLAKIMMTDSDNSATNMILERIGGKVDLNRALRSWGMKSTHMENWLPDLKGGNVSTAKELAVMLYNIDNSNFLDGDSTDKILEYMSQVKNDRLLKAGLPKTAGIIHKTGDIGTMLGDAGIITTETGKKYIAVILVKRPYNNPLGKEFIVKASKLIYEGV